MYLKIYHDNLYGIAVAIISVIILVYFLVAKDPFMVKGKFMKAEAAAQ